MLGLYFLFGRSPSRILKAGNQPKEKISAVVNVLGRSHGLASAIEVSCLLSARVQVLSC